jgi:hypothetical protein
LAGIQSSLVPEHGKGMRVVEELPDLDACPLCRVEDRDPALGGVGRMRDEDVGGEGQSLVLGAIPFGVVEEERVTPRRLWRRVLLACGNRHYARLAADVFDDLGFSHRAMITLGFRGVLPGSEV